MTPKQTLLVKNSWALATSSAENIAELFLGKLFKLDPALKSLFKGNDVEQGRKLMSMISTVVYSLDTLEANVPAMDKLGERHVGYGVKEKDYDTLISALLWTLKISLAEAFTPDLKEAWTDVFNELTNMMKAAAIDNMNKQRENGMALQPV